MTAIATPPTVTYDPQPPAHDYDVAAPARAAEPAEPHASAWGGRGTAVFAFFTLGVVVMTAIISFGLGVSEFWVLAPVMLTLFAFTAGVLVIINFLLTDYGD